MESLGNSRFVGNFSQNSRQEVRNPLNGTAKIQLPERMQFKNKTHHKGHHVDNASYINFRRQLRAPLFRGR